MKANFLIMLPSELCHKKTRSNTNWYVVAEKGTKLEILDFKDALYHLNSKNKDTDQLCSTAQLICVFAYIAHLYHTVCTYKLAISVYNGVVSL